MMLRRLLIAALMSLCSEAAAAQVAVKGDWVSLGDIASSVTGEAALILVSPAPPVGQKLALDPVFVAGVAKKAGVAIVIPLDQPIWVTRVASTAPVAKQAPTAPVAPQAAAANEGLVLTMARDVARGDKLTANDVTWIKSARSRNGLPGDIDLVVGMMAKRPLKANAVLMSSDVAQPSVVRKGEPVKLVYVKGGLQLTAEGLAQNDAALGDNVRVLNQYSKRSVDAVASAEGEARVATR